MPRHRFCHPQSASLERLARCEALVINDHPLVIAGTALVPNLQVGPLRACCGQARGNHCPHPRQHGLRLNILPQRLVVVLDGGLCDRKSCIGDIPIVATVQASRIRSEDHAPRLCFRQGHVKVLHRPQHGSVLIPCDMPCQEVGVARCGLDQYAAMAPVSTVFGIGTASGSPPAAMPVVRIDKLTILHNCSEEVVHVGVYNRLHQHCRLRQNGFPGMSACSVVAICQATELFQEEAHMAPIRITTRFALHLLLHPAKVVFRKPLRNRWYRAD
mmetsp:Transcript_78476/g.197166  ORF Transcript_78476/g.197166 Transcript_78476/m.197166 type:complete len:272 (+) Transcript_78476:1017-1832(+)